MIQTHTITYTTQRDAYAAVRCLLLIRKHIAECMSTELSIVVNDDFSITVSLELPSGFIGISDGNGIVYPSLSHINDVDAISELIKCEKGFVCHKCHRSTSKGTCYAFSSEQGVVMYGRDCAADMFGMQVTPFCERVLKSLSRVLMSGFPEVQSTFRLTDSYMLAACHVILKYGVHTRLKEHMSECDSMRNSAIESLYGLNPFDETSFKAFLRLLCGGYGFFSAMDAETSSWNSKSAQAGSIIFSGSPILKKNKDFAIRMSPWCAATYFDRTSGYGERKYRRLSPFEGGKLLDGTVSKIIPRMTEGGKVYFAILGVTRYRCLVWWNTFDCTGYKVGDSFLISAMFHGYAPKNPMYSMLSSVINKKKE